MKLIPLVEELERLQFKLQVEASINAEDRALAKRLADLALETADALDRVKSFLGQPDAMG